MSRTATPTTKAILDVLADGKWHDRATVEAAAIEASISADANWCIKAFDAKPTAVKGRITKTVKAEQGAIAQVKKSRSRLLVRGIVIQTSDKTKMRLAVTAPDETTVTVDCSTTVATTVTVESPAKYVSGYKIAEAARENGREKDIPSFVINDVHEDDIWATSPVFEADRLQWKFADDFDATILLPYLPGKAWSRTRMDGISRIWVEAGQGEAARTIVSQWCAAHNVEINGALRLYPAVTFRDTNLIPEDLRNGLVLATTRWLMIVAAKHIAKVIADNDMLTSEDSESLVYLFVNDLLDQYDETRIGKTGDKALNFRAFAISKIPNWAPDLLRATRTRRGVDEATAYNRAMTAFMDEHHRTPNRQELALTMNTTVDALIRIENSINVFNNVRHAASLTAEWDDNEDSRAVVVADESEDTEEAGMNRLVSATISRAILTAVNGNTIKKPGNAVDPIGLLVTYSAHWNASGTQEMADAFGVSHKAVSHAQKRVQTAIEEEMAALR